MHFWQYATCYSGYPTTETAATCICIEPDRADKVGIPEVKET
jgi:hypothetical protein